MQLVTKTLFGSQVSFNVIELNPNGDCKWKQVSFWTSLTGQIWRKTVYLQCTIQTVASVNMSIVCDVFLSMLHTLCRGIYRRGSGNKFIGNIGENIGNYHKISAKIVLELKNYENIRQIGNTKNSGEIQKYREKSEIFATLISLIVSL